MQCQERVKFGQQGKLIKAFKSWALQNFNHLMMVVIGAVLPAPIYPPPKKKLGHDGVSVDEFNGPLLPLLVTLGRRIMF